MELVQADNGSFYYYNQKTEETSWTRPPALAKRVGVLSPQARVTGTPSASPPPPWRGATVRTSVTPTRASPYTQAGYTPRHPRTATLPGDSVASRARRGSAASPTEHRRPRRANKRLPRASSASTEEVAWTSPAHPGERTLLSPDAEGWIQCVSSEGWVYHYNNKTGESQWASQEEQEKYDEWMKAEGGADGGGGGEVWVDTGTTSVDGWVEASSDPKTAWGESTAEDGDADPLEDALKATPNPAKHVVTPPGDAIKQLRAQVTDLRKQLVSLSEPSDDTVPKSVVADMVTSHKAALADTVAAHDAALSTAAAAHAEALQAANAARDEAERHAKGLQEEVEALRAAQAAAAEAAAAAHNNALANLTEAHEAELAEVTARHKASLVDAVAAHDAAMASTASSERQAVADAREEAAQAKAAAEEAEARALAQAVELQRIKRDMASAEAAHEADLQATQAAAEAAAAKDAARIAALHKLVEEAKAAAQHQADEAVARVVAEHKKSLSQLHVDYAAKIGEAAAAATEAEAQRTLEEMTTLREQTRQAVTAWKREAGLRREVHNKMVDMIGSIRVFCRVRPVLSHEVESGESDIVVHPVCDEDCLELDGLSHKRIVPGGGGKFQFDRVFQGSSQAEVFEDIGPLIRSVLNGFNVCIFAYGQTGSGKTFTMEGPSDDRGVNFRSLQQLFAVQEAESSMLAMRVKVSVVEVYNERVHDLLAPPPPRGAERRSLDIRQGTEQESYLHDVSLATVSCFEDVVTVMDKASAHRAVGVHNLNDHTSRSHLVVQVTAAVDHFDGVTTTAKLNLVDLAGSERVSKTAATGDALKEAQHINKSLSALGDVISSLAKKASHIPYRNSKLTYLLQSSLAGTAKVLMVVNCSPVVWNQSETACSLHFAARCRKVRLGKASRRESKTASGGAGSSSVLSGTGSTFHDGAP